MSNLFWLTDEQMSRLRPYFPKSHVKPRVIDRRVRSGIIFINHNGLRWSDAPREYGPPKTLYNIIVGNDGSIWVYSLGSSGHSLGKRKNTGSRSLDPAKRYKTLDVMMRNLDICLGL